MVKRKELPPVTPALWEVADAAAVQACVRGDASADQQKRAINWIMYKAAAIGEFAFRPGENDRETNIALGRQFVGHSIAKMLAINTSAFRRKVDETPSSTE